MIALKRVYDPLEEGDGIRFLVDRLWPRGIKKESLQLDGWLKEIAPSNELRRWFGHDKAKWDEFKTRYFAELEKMPGAVAQLLDAARSGRISLLYSAHDTEHNNAAALKEYLDEKLRI